MSVRQRNIGNKAKNGGTTPKPTQRSKTDKGIDKVKVSQTNGRKKRPMTLKDLVLFSGCFVGIIYAILYHYYCKYGMTMFLGHGFFDFKWSPYQWRDFMDSNEKTILLIGGPHRSGTTLVWDIISQHPDIAGFGDRFETGVDYSEGVLFQEVYPRFGVGLEFRHNMLSQSSKDKPNTIGGLGQYSLLPEHQCHWTDENQKEKLQDPFTLSKLMNRFAPYWDTSKKHGRTNGLKSAKVLVEKSPQNAILSRFLEGLYNMPIREDGTVGLIKDENKALVTKFIFLTRDPISNVYAIEKFVAEAMGGFLDFEKNLRNYLQLHKYMIHDDAYTKSPLMWIRLEDFVANPSTTLKKVFSFLDLSTDMVDSILHEFGPINPDPNKKYIEKWCNKDKIFRDSIIAKYNGPISDLNLGYDLVSLCT